MNFKTSIGFSLLEIVVSMLILSLVVAGIFGLFITSHKFIGEAGRRLQATNYARQVLETLKVYVSANANYPANAGTAFTNGLHTNLIPIGLSNSITLQGITYNCNYNVTTNPAGTTGLREVRANVTWTEP